ncbi:hypothetical protein RCL_jg5237.t1 [Rhizophagus clarus]|uniref:SEC7 domain-containing protein n=1 Tax=Rhizophagus clarus TaxID=94130 RepID=A0A8H3QQE1_9GLOM|nr:hypothetical protein RCL_jg5237.t1 [Rhizophagus clarus]
MAFICGIFADYSLKIRASTINTMSKYSTSTKFSLSVFKSDDEYTENSEATPAGGKKDIINGINNTPSSNPISKQLVVPANVLRHNNKDTTKTESNNYFTTDHSVSQSVIGSISVPNLTAPNNELEAEYDALIKQKYASGFSNVSYDLRNEIVGGKSLNSQSKKSGKRKGNLISTEKNDDKGFKNTMKNTMRKTSTFFKKLGNKQNADNQSQQNIRPPLPDFQDGSNLQPQSPSSEEPQSAPSSTINATDTSNSDELLNTNDDATSSDSESNNELHEFLQNTLAVYANLQDDDENRRKSGLYRMSLLGGNKSVPDNIGRNYEWDGQTSNNKNENIHLTNEESFPEYTDRRDSSNTFMSLPIIKGDKMKAESKEVMEVMKAASLEEVREVDSENASISRKKYTTKVIVSKSSSKSSFRESTNFDKGLSKINIDQRGLLMKPNRPESTSASSITSSTASGSTTTLHTAPPSPITDVTDGTPKIQIDDFVLSESPIDNVFDDGNHPPRVPKKDEDEILWSKARIAAKKCFYEDETFIKKEDITKYLGGHELINSRALKCYMEYYDFSNLRLDVAFRRLCGKLYIKAETQQLDRILEGFSIRYWECNPKTIYGNSDVVHAVAYSILLLNTDLHVAQVANKMSRSQFVRNTMAAIYHAQATTAAQNNNESYEDDQSTITSVETNTTGTSATARPRRSGSIRSWRSNPNSSLTNVSFMSRQFSSEIESLLKEMYSAIKSNQILQPVLSPEKAAVEQSNTPSPGLHRSMSLTGHPNTRINALKKGLSAGNVKSRKNVNGRISPSPSSVSGGSDSSIGFDGLNRSGSSQTLPTTSSSFSLRHTSSSETNSMIPEMIDEHGDTDDRASIADSISTTESLELYLSGAPYAKEGLLVRKHYWESTNKRSKDKGWKECFVIVEKGDIKMYKFETNSSNSSVGTTGAIGGGNWMSSAILMGEVNLRHTITNALPPPGYNRSRPHVFALSMPNGGLYFFQAGTAELVNEWVATCNYWAACKSKEPLTGGVSSMEYGWSRSILDGGEDLEDGKSIMSDGRSVMSGNSTHASDRIVVSEWKAPLPPTVSSNFDEETQLAALKKYKADLENELEEHKNFWEPMTKVFHPKSSNYTKAFSNWEKKSKWLLYEIVKYTTYIECINNSISIREERRKEKEKSKHESSNPLVHTINIDEETKKEKTSAELRTKARQSVKLFHRATWTPGDGTGLNLPKELLFGGILSNLEEEEDNENLIPENSFDRLNGKMKSSTYPLPYDKKVVIEEEKRIGDFNTNIDYEAGHKWVDRFV